MINYILNKIRVNRIEKNYSQAYLASKLQISQSYYAKIERGKTDLTLARFIVIAAVLEMKPQDFFKK